jgi:hypothetical protein
MIEYWNRWVAFWSEVESPHTLAGFRICMGFTLLYTFCSPYLSDAWIAIWVDATEGGIRHYNNTPWMLDWLGGPTQQGVERLILLGIGASIGLILGIGSRWMALMGMFAMNTVSWHNPMASGGHDDLIANGLWILFFASSDTTWSLTCKIKHQSWHSTTPIPAFARRLLLFQLVVMYCSTGLQKVSAHWIPFGSMDALWYILQQPTWAKHSFEWLAPWFVITQLATLGTWLFEVFSPLFLLWLFYSSPERIHRVPNFLQPCLHWPIRPIFMLIGIGMHVGIWLTMDVGPFSFAAISYYWTILPTMASVEKLPPSTSSPSTPTQGSHELPESVPSTNL